MLGVAYRALHALTATLRYAVKDLASWRLDTGYWGIGVLGYWVLGYWVELVFGLWYVVLGIGYSGYLVYDTGSWILDILCWLLESGDGIWNIGYGICGIGH